MASKKNLSIVYMPLKNTEKKRDRNKSLFGMPHECFSSSGFYKQFDIEIYFVLSYFRYKTNVSLRCLRALCILLFIYYIGYQIMFTQEYCDN